MRLGLCLVCADKGHIWDNCHKRRDYGTTTVNAIAPVRAVERLDSDGHSVVPVSSSDTPSSSDTLLVIPIYISKAPYYHAQALVDSRANKNIINSTYLEMMDLVAWLEEFQTGLCLLTAILLAQNQSYGLGG